MGLRSVGFFLCHSDLQFEDRADRIYLMDGLFVLEEQFLVLKKGSVVNRLSVPFWSDGVPENEPRILYQYVGLSLVNILRSVFQF